MVRGEVPTTTRMEVWMAAIVTPVGSARPGVVTVPWGLLAAIAAAVTLLWLVTMEGSLVSEVVGGAPSFLHELFHDGRHLLGVPCH